SRSERNHLPGAFGFDLCGFRGAALNQSKRKLLSVSVKGPSLYTGLTSEMPRKGQDMFCITATL
ncbi:hypothetical protein ACV2F0_24085, partial [Salmonella enterica subsp. enterica serovar 1,4,[5],12:i:-]